LPTFSRFPANTAGLASEVARLKARFVIKDADLSLRGAA
jgi:hypothetical protein